MMCLQEEGMCLVEVFYSLLRYIFHFGDKFVNKELIPQYVMALDNWAPILLDRDIACFLKWLFSFRHKVQLGILPICLKIMLPTNTLSHLPFVIASMFL